MQLETRIGCWLAAQFDGSGILPQTLNSGINNHSEWNLSPPPKIDIILKIRYNYDLYYNT